MTKLPPSSALMMLALAWGALACLGAQENGAPTAEWGEVVQYLRADGVVYGAIVRDGSGEELRRETYVRDGDGTLLETVIRLPDGTMERVGASFRKQWMAVQGSSGVYRTYNPDGTLRTEEERSGDVVLRRETYEHGGEPPRLVALVRELPVEGSKKELTYGTDGLVVRETRTERDGKTETSLYAYDDKRRVTEIRTRSGRSDLRTAFSYAADGDTTEERFDATGALVLRIVTKADGGVVEEHFDSGALFARTLFKDGRKVREEIVSNGQVVRVWESP